MKLSRSVAYALQATLLLAEYPSRGPVPCSRLAEAGQLPERFLLQILRTLVTHGILDSTRGVDGGYSLRRAVSDISLFDLIEAVEGPVEPSSVTGHGLSLVSQERMHGALQELTAVCRKQLKSIKLSSLLNTHAEAH
ncbi:MAG: Rrf2 family transcriptional regulator [Planctomycetes bacterium]|nr:Rrf2 family transcriptional regulator [Planctomycetota bacterium]